ncbi:Influenza virus NS1A-binding [Nymphon striatum]|nr:Influenza virus NS1A-binding [Nymphon striatum]
MLQIYRRKVVKQNQTLKLVLGDIEETSSLKSRVSMNSSFDGGPSAQNRNFKRKRSNSLSDSTKIFSAGIAFSFAHQRVTRNLAQDIGLSPETVRCLSILSPQNNSVKKKKKNPNETTVQNKPVTEGTPSTSNISHYISPSAESIEHLTSSPIVQKRKSLKPPLCRKRLIDVMDAARDVMGAVRDVIPVACEALPSKMLLLLWLRSIPCFNTTAATREALRAKYDTAQCNERMGGTSEVRSQVNLSQTQEERNVIPSNEEELNEKLICIGGNNNQGNEVISIEICSDFGSTWNKFHRIDTGRYGFACCTYKNNIILIGGTKAYRLCTEYDPKNITFTELEPLPDERCEHVATIINSKLLVVGGLYKKQSLISLNLDEKNGKWRDRKSSSELKNGSTGCSVNDKFYVFGALLSNSCECYCPQDDSWRSFPKMKEERYLAGCCSDNNKFIYVVGGWDWKNNTHLTSMERFDVVIEQWSSLKSSIGVGRQGLTLTVFKNQIILIGGRDEDDKKYKTIQKYDSISDSWSQIGNLNDARAYHCTVNLKF